MKKSKPEKKNEPPMRPIEEVYEKMGGKDWPVRECPYYQIGLNGDADKDYSCFLTGGPDADSRGWGYKPCDFKGEDYRECQMYATERGRISKSVEQCPYSRAGKKGAIGTRYCAQLSKLDAQSGVPTFDACTFRGNYEECPTRKKYRYHSNI